MAAEQVIYTNEASLAGAGDLQTALAASLIRLFDETLSVTVNTVKADLVGAETTLVGYPVGGYPVATMHDPIFGAAGGAIIISPLVQPEYASGAAVQIGGYWVEDAGGAVRQVVKFTPAKNLAVVGDGFPVVAQFGYGGPAQV